MKFYDFSIALSHIELYNSKILKNENIIMAPVEGEKYLSDVADLDWYIGCSPTAGANLIYYWALNGYPDLTYYKTSNEVIEDLAYFMNTSPNGSTIRSNIVPGILDYIWWNLGSNWNGSMISSPSFISFKYEIDNNRPVLFSIDNDTSSYEYGNHSVTGAGYYYFGDENYAIIHDTWGSTPKKVYYLYPTSIKYMHKIIPD